MRIITLLDNKGDPLIRILLIGISIMWITSKIWRCYKEKKAMDLFKSNKEIKEIEITRQGIKIKR